MYIEKRKENAHLQLNEFSFYRNFSLFWFLEKINNNQALCESVVASRVWSNGSKDIHMLRRVHPGPAGESDATGSIKSVPSKRTVKIENRTLRLKKED